MSRNVEVSVLTWGARRNGCNPLHCGKRTYKLFIQTHQLGKVNVGFYCRVCGAIIREAKLLEGENES